MRTGIRHLRVVVLFLAPIASVVAAPVAVDDLYTPNATSFVVPAATGLLANDSGTAPLSVTVVNITGLKGTLSPFADGRFTFAPQAGLATNTGFTYTMTDASGATASATVTFDMVSTLPAAAADSYTPNAASFIVPAATGLLANDSGGIGSLAVSVVNITGLKGTLTPFADGRFTFAPQAGLATNTGFTYTMGDQLGRTSSNTVTFDMVSTLPVATADTYTPNATSFVVPAAAGLLANDSGGIGSLAVSVVNITGLKGTLTPFADGRFTFAPQAGLATNTGFTYTMSDQLGRTSSETVTFDMVSTLPSAIDDFYDVFSGATLSVGPLGLLTNDLGGIGSLSVSVVNITGLQGTLTPFANGSFSFAPSPGFVGTTSFDYVMRDELGRVSTSTAEIHVLATGGTVPEPATLALFSLGLAGLAASRRRKQ